MKNYNIGDLVEGVVTGIEDYGVFVLVDNIYTGLVHISEISDSYVKNVSDYADLDEKIYAKVIGYDDNNHLKLSVKDIDYRPNKKIYNSIKETKSGFDNLRKSLDTWIDTKYDEISEKM